MHFNFYFNCIQQGDDSTSWADWLNVVIALINLLLVVYIFRHQRKKDTDERVFQINSKSKEYKHNWFKEIIILPKIELLNNHFIEIEKITTRLKLHDLTSKQRNNIDKSLKTEFRTFSKDFVELIYAVNNTFATQIQDVSDKCLENIQKQVHSPSKSLSDDGNYNELILEEIRTYKNKIISKIYNFEDLN